ncbi:hypothetical protein [uncultured Corynebacterium sp.]|nr:hypothetical protein [uncultured Corynebacterium sp.]
MNIALGVAAMGEPSTCMYAFFRIIAVWEAAQDALLGRWFFDVLDYPR